MDQQAEHAPSAPTLGPAWPWYIGGVACAAVVAFPQAVLAYELPLRSAVNAPGFILDWCRIAAVLGVCLVLGVVSWRAVWRRTVGTGRSQIWRVGVLQFGGVMLLISSMAKGAEPCGGWSLSVLTCQSFAADVLVQLCLGSAIWTWGGYAFGSALLGGLGLPGSDEAP